MINSALRRSLFAVTFFSILSLPGQATAGSVKEVETTRDPTTVTEAGQIFTEAAKFEAAGKPTNGTYTNQAPAYAPQINIEDIKDGTGFGDAPVPVGKVDDSTTPQPIN